MASPGSLDRVEYGTDEKPVTTKRLWYRTTMFNAHIIGMVGFTAPGLWNAMNSLGAGGAREPYLVNAGNALVFGLMGVFCLLGATVANYIGLAWTLVLGAVGYPLYSAGLYTNFKFGNVWFVFVGSAIDGVSAGLFWASEGAIAVGYPEPALRGKYLNIWVWWRTLGPIIGGAIVLALNYKTSTRGHVSTNTYLVFIALQCLSVPIALLLTPAHKVQRNDGSKVIVAPKASFKKTFSDLWKALKRREILLLCPLFAAAYFNSYSSTFTSLYFSLRARSLNGFLGNFPILVASQLISTLLDYKGLSRKKRLVYGFYLVIAVHILAWVYALIIIADYKKNTPVLDWADGRLYARGFFVDVLWSFSKQILQTWLYYLMGTLTEDITELTRYTGILRGMESFAQAVAYGLNASKAIDTWVPIGINMALLVLSIYPTWLVVRDSDPREDHEREADLKASRDSSSSLDGEKEKVRD